MSERLDTSDYRSRRRWVTAVLLLLLGTGAAAAGAAAGRPADAVPAAAGYALAAADGTVTNFGVPAFTGSMAGHRPGAPIVAVAAASTGGYWLASSAGAVFSFGGARSAGSLAGHHLSRPIVAMAAAPTGGYWLVSSNGAAFGFGAARVLSPAGHRPTGRIVAVAAAPTGGYWLASSAGGVFGFGGARYSGSLAGRRLSRPVVGMAAGPNGGYWLVTSDGAVFAFGGAHLAGSLQGHRLGSPIVGMAAAPGGGYWLVSSSGGVFSFGGARFAGSLGGHHPRRPIVGMAAAPVGVLTRSSTTPAPAARPAAPTGDRPPYSVTVTAVPGSIPGDDRSTATISATVMRGGAAVSGERVTFSVASGSGCGTIGSPYATTSDTGRVTTTYTAGFGSGFCAVTATEARGGRSGSVNVDQLSYPQPIDAPYSVMVTVSPSTMRADGVSTVTVSATVTDRSGAPVPGDRIGFYVDGAGCGTLESAGGSTSAEGVSTTTYVASTRRASCTIGAVEADTGHGGSAVLIQT